MADLFAVYEEIAFAITDKLRISLGKEAVQEPAVLATNTDAYDHYLQGRSILERADDEARVLRADRLFERSLEFEPEYARALAGRCEANTLMYEFSRSVQWVGAAEDYCRQALQVDDSLVDARVALARLYTMAGRQDDALSELDSARKTDADNPDIWRHLGQVYAARGASDEAEDAFLRARRIASGDVRIYHELGAFYFDIGRYDQAVDVYSEMVDISGGSSAAYTGLGASLTIQGKFEEAAAAYRMAIQNDPNPRTYANAGSAYFYQGRFDEAALMMREAVDLSPEDFRLVGNLADAVRFLPGKSEEAKNLYQRAADLAEVALAINRNDLDVVYMLPHFYAQLGKSQEARDAIDTALALGPDHNYVYYYAGLAWMELGQNDEALDAFRIAVQLGYPWKLLAADPQLEGISQSADFQRIGQSLGRTSRGT
jgi:serine/threonine-protein kinase